MQKCIYFLPKALASKLLLIHTNTHEHTHTQNTLLYANHFPGASEFLVGHHLQAAEY